MKLIIMKFNLLKDKTAIVTGASGGIGREIVKLLDQNGVYLVLSVIDEERLNEIGKKLSQEPVSSQEQ